MFANLVKLTNIKRINFNNLQIGDIGAIALSKAMETSLKFLEILELDNNEITDKGMNLFEFSKQTKLRILSLNNNKINAGGCNNFQSINYKSLEKLSLYNNSIKSEGLIIILNGLKKEEGCKLKELNVGSNSIDEIIPSEYLNNLIQQKKVSATEHLYKYVYENEGERYKQKISSGMDALMESLSSLKSLNLVNFSANIISIIFYNFRCFFFRITFKTSSVNYRKKYYFLFE